MKFGIVTLIAMLCLAISPAFAVQILTDPTLETGTSWTLCSIPITTGHPCGPAAPHAGTSWAGNANGSGTIVDWAAIQAKSVAAGNQTLSVWVGAGNGTASNLSLRMGAGTATCTGPSAFGTQVAVVADNSCLTWKNLAGVFNAVSTGTYSFVAVATQNQGWSCGGGFAVDDASWDGTLGMEDWSLY